MKKIKCFVGVIGSGKDYQCQQLIKDGYTQIAFADTLRELTWKIFKWEPKSPEDYEDFKSTLFTAAGYPSISGREFLQRLGTDARKLIDENIWVTSINKRISESRSNKICISDMRFRNEFNYITNFSPAKYDIEIVFTNYKSPRYNSTDSHDSEKMAQEFLTDKGYIDLETIFRNQPRVGDTILIRHSTSLHNKFVGVETIIEEIVNDGIQATDYITSEGLTLNRLEFDIIKYQGLKPLTDF